jgi:hypothetical protein
VLLDEELDKILKFKQELCKNNPFDMNERKVRKFLGQIGSWHRFVIED